MDETIPVDNSNVIDQPIARPKRPYPKHTKKRSLKAQKVAWDISEAIAKGKKIDESTFGNILLKNGYAKSTSESPSVIMNTLSFREAIYPVIQKMGAIRDKTLTTLENKDFTDEPVASLAQLLKVINHDTRLLSGESTSNVAMNVNLTSLFDGSSQ